MPYFDHNATTPLSAPARTAWLRAQDEAWQNPSSPHRAGTRVRLRVEAARTRLGQLLDTDPARLVFTSGATEAADAVMSHLARTLPVDRPIGISEIEHPSVIEAARLRFGEDRLRWIPVSRSGAVAVSSVGTLLDQVGAIVVMAVNSETGVLQPWHEIAAACRDARVPYVCDLSQWLGKLSAGGVGQVDWAFASAHKFGGPKGVGVLMAPSDSSAAVFRPGGGQERGQRSGTEDYPGIVAMVAALSEAEESKVLFEADRQVWRTLFEQELVSQLPRSAIVGADAERLWNTVTVVLPHGENQRWVARLDQRGIEVSTGAACATGKAGPSHVLAAMGYTPDQARRTIRISAGWETTREQWTELVSALVAVAAEVKPADGVISL